MKRRAFIAGLGAAAWPVGARGQRGAKLRRVGFLGLGQPSDWQGPIEALRSGLNQLGYSEGKNVIIEYRWAPATSNLYEAAEQLVRLNVDVIVAPASTQVEPAVRATKTIPIVFAQHADPVGVGHVASLAHPGGNATGVSMLLAEMSLKGLEILTEVAPWTKRVGVLWNLTTPTHPQVLALLENAARQVDLILIGSPISTVSDFEAAFAFMSDNKADCVLVPSSPITNAQRSSLAELGLRYRLPTMFANRANVEAGGLISYGPNFNDMYRHVAVYIVKLLKGARPSDLPVEQASKYELVINLKTARALASPCPQRFWRVLMKSLNSEVGSNA